MSSEDQNSGPDSFRRFLIENRQAVAKWPEWKRSQANLGIQRAMTSTPEVPVSSGRRSDLPVEKK